MEWIKHIVKHSQPRENPYPFATGTCKQPSEHRLQKVTEGISEGYEINTANIIQKTNGTILYTIMKEQPEAYSPTHKLLLSIQLKLQENDIYSIVHTTLRLCRLHLKSTQISLIARSTIACSAVRLLVIRHIAKQDA
jgi:hypothetical protein